jgi:phosphoenolpyruvate carboxylase
MTLSQASMAAYRALVYETPGFTDYFFGATPIREIAELNIGSRPASRKASQRIEDLRAIPWGFSWGQCRLTLPGWYGFGSAVEAFLKQPTPAARKEALALLQKMYRQWPFFRALLSNMDMVLAKSDLALASRYSRAGHRHALRKRVFAAIEAEWHRTAEALGQITGDKHRLASNAALAALHPPPLPLHRPAAPSAGGAGAALPRRQGRRARASRHPHFHQRHRRRLAQHRLRGRAARYARHP